MQNIVKNCLEHMDNGGTLRLTGTQTALYCRLVIELCIRDRVAGVPSPFRSASPGISSLPAFSIADRRVSSV